VSGVKLRPTSDSRDNESMIELPTVRSPSSKVEEDAEQAILDKHMQFYLDFSKEGKQLRKEIKDSRKNLKPVSLQ